MRQASTKSVSGDASVVGSFQTASVRRDAAPGMPPRLAGGNRNETVSFFCQNTQMGSQRILLMNDPKVAVLDWIAVVLEEDWQWIGSFGLSRPCFADEFHVVMNFATV